MNPPCYNREMHADCPDRRAGCHTTCEKYKKFEAANKDERERRYLENKDSYRDQSPARRRSLIRMLNRNKR